jgi:hypothetical protein
MYLASRLEKRIITGLVAAAQGDPQPPGAVNSLRKRAGAEFVFGARSSEGLGHDRETAHGVRRVHEAISPHPVDHPGRVLRVASTALTTPSGAPEKDDVRIK